MLNIYYASQMFLPNMHGLNLSKIKKSKTVLNAFVEIVHESNHKPNNLWLIKEQNFIKKTYAKMVRQ